MKKMIVLFVGLIVFSASAKPGQVLSKTLYHEARGEGEVGIRAVASVIYNRAMKSSGKADYSALSAECLKKYQFSCWNGKNDLTKGQGKVADLCMKVAKEMVAGTFKPTHSYTYYHAYKICEPKQAIGKSFVLIGNHKFYKA